MLPMTATPAFAQGHAFTFTDTTTDYLYGNDNGATSTVEPSLYSNDGTNGVNTSGNRVTINSPASLDNGSGTGSGPIGGHAAGNGVDANSNTVTLNGSKFNLSVIYGGYALQGNASGNKVYLRGGTYIEVFVLGGFTENAGSSASGNEVHMSGGEGGVDITGGKGVNGATATGNKVFISGGNSGQVQGGVSDGGSASGNEVHMSGGEVIYNITGGMGYSGATVTGNKVFISGGSVGTVSNPGTIYAGRTDVPGYATDNSVTISGTPDFSYASIYGTDDATGWATAGNTLNMETSGIKAVEVNYFQNYSFKLTSSATVLTVDNAADITGITVTLDDAALKLKEGDAITLIDASATGVTGEPATTTVDGLRYSWILYVADGKLIAKVTGFAPGAQPVRPVILRRVTLDVSPHFLSDVPAGLSYVESSRDLVITLTPRATLPDDYLPQVTTSRTTDSEGGITVTHNGGAWTVRIRRVQEAITVTIAAVASSAGTATAVADIADAQVRTFGSRLYIAATQPGEAYIYNVYGMRVKAVPVIAGETVAGTLPAGVYIVVLEGRRYKVAVK
jgi:hypothetical protein